MADRISNLRASPDALESLPHCRTRLERPARYVQYRIRVAIGEAYLESMFVGFARDCGADRSLELQLRALSDAGCAKIFSEQRGGTPAGVRSAFHGALDFVRDGDTLVVTGLDRLAPSLSDINGIIARLARRGVNFRCLQQSRAIRDSGHGGLFWPSLALSLPSLNPTLNGRVSAIG